MKRLIIMAALFVIVITTSTAAFNPGKGISINTFQQQTITAKLKSSSRLFGVKYDLTSVIMVIPSGMVVTVIGSDSTYYKVRYLEDEGYIYKQDASILEVSSPVEKTVQQNNVNNNQQQDKPVNRLEYLENKYGSSLAAKMNANKIWKGMTAEMIVDSWGKPYKINRTIDEEMIREEWIYKSTWLLIENDKLVQWGPVTK